MSSEIHNRALLPTGLHDLLPPRAQQEEETVRLLLAAFGAYGYEQVKPPLVEFESTLLGSGGTGVGSLAGQMFRLMEPVRQQMMAVSADMHWEVERVVETRERGGARRVRRRYATGREGRRESRRQGGVNSMGRG